MSGDRVPVAGTEDKKVKDDVGRVVVLGKKITGRNSGRTSSGMTTIFR